MLSKRVKIMNQRDRVGDNGVKINIGTYPDSFTISYRT